MYYLRTTVDPRTILFALLSKHRINNMLNAVLPKGKFICDNGLILRFDKGDKTIMERLFLLSSRYGVRFNEGDGYWKLDLARKVVITPQGITFTIDSVFPLIFAETFLDDIHFVEFDLKDRIVVQAGGFVGDTALYYASRGASVYSFEPDPIAYSKALRNIKLNPALSGRIVMKDYAVGKDGVVRFPVDLSLQGGSSTYAVSAQKYTEVRSVSITTILNEFNITRPYLLDLDIKGNEFEVINDDQLKKFEVIRIEYTTKINGSIIGERDTIVRKLKEFGFDLIRIYRHNDLRDDLKVHGTIEAKKSGASVKYLKG